MMVAMTTSSVFKVAVVQMRPKPLDAEHNFAYAAEQIRHAAAEGASLAVLPEYHLTGWVPEEPSFALSFEEANRYLRRYQDLAAELHVNICAGTVVFHAPPPEHQQQQQQQNKAGSGSEDLAGQPRPRLLNTSHFIDHDGNLLGSYTKTNLWITERQHLTSSIQYTRQVAESSGSSSNPHQVIDTPLGPVGILVCWDLAFPEAFRQLVLAGAKIIIIPSYWTAADMCQEGLAYNPDCEKLMVQTTLITRAFENTAALIYCNVGGPADEGFFGCSQVVLPIVGPVPGGFADGEEAMRVFDVDMRTVEIAEKNYKIREDLGRGDWHYGYSKGRDAGQPNSRL